MKYATLAKHLNLSRWNIERRLHGEVKLFMEEATAIRDFLGLDMPLEELFRRDDGSVPDMTPKPYVYPVLAAILQKRKITFKQLAKVLGVHKNTVSYKMHGLGNFTPAQMEATKKFLGTEMSVEELFKRNE